MGVTNKNPPMGYIVAYTPEQIADLMKDQLGGVPQVSQEIINLLDNFHIFFFRPSVAVGPDGLMESCTRRRCR